jgi:hypothetical protein
LLNLWHKPAYAEQTSLLLEVSKQYWQVLPRALVIGARIAGSSADANVGGGKGSGFRLYSTIAYLSDASGCQCGNW